ncbi:MAG: RHS repeat domain-containing protein, partial [Actinomycetota bacterium]
MPAVPAGEATAEAIRDRFGNQLTVTRPGPTQAISRLTTPHGRWVDFTYVTFNGWRYLTEARDNLGRVVSYTYDFGSGTGRLVTVTDAAGGVTAYTYDSAHRIVTITDARGLVFLTNLYGAGGRVDRQTQADGTTFQFAYTVDGSGKVTQTDVTGPRGDLRRVTFNADGYGLSDTLALTQP